MLRKIRLSLLAVLFLVTIPIIAVATCDFEWWINGVHFQCSLTTHEYIYTYSHTTTTSSGSQIHYHKKGMKHVSSREVSSMPDASVWIEDGTTEQCTAVTIPAVPGNCLETGLSSGSKCKYCNHIITEQTETPKKGHTIVNDPAVPATCTETGLTAGRHCKICNTILTEQSVVPAKGHTWSAGTIISEPTALQPGVTTYICSSCNQTKEDELPALVDASGSFGNGLSWHMEVPDPTINECILILSGNGAMPAIWSTSTHPDWYVYRDYITVVIIEDGITNVSGYALYNCSNLAEARLGNTVTTIDGNVFGSCPKLADIYIPQSVLSISDQALHMGTSATTIHVYYNSYAYTFFKNSGRKIEFYTSGSSGSIFWSLSDSGVLTFSGEGVLTGELAGQAEKEQVNAVIIQEGITSITGTAFYDYSSLKSITLPMSMTDIGSAFYYGNINKTFYCSFRFGSEICTTLSNRGGKIVSNYYPSLKVRQLQNTDMSYSISVEGLTGQDTTVIVPEVMDGVPVTSIKSPLNSNIVEIIIEANIETLSEGAFQSCPSLKNIILPTTLTSIPDNAFYRCDSLESINIPASVTSIGNNAFDGCGSLETIILPNNLIRIPECAFRHCTSLSSITIPNSVVSVGPYAFYDCPALQEISFSGGRLGIDDYAFYNCAALHSIEMPAVLSHLGNYAFYNCNKLRDIVIPNGIERIGGNAFQKCSGLTSIAIPSSVYAISPYAFADCTGLRSIQLPDALTLFDTSVFNNCTSLIKVLYKPNSQTANLLKQYGFFTTYTGCILSGQIRKGSTYYDITDLIDKPIVGNSAGNLLAWTENNQLVAICPGYEKHFVSINSTTVYTLYITVLDVSGEIIMPESLIRIENDAFNSVPVQKVVISNKCVSIDSGAFAGSNCVVAFIPDSVESIAEDAFPDSLITVKTNSYNSPVTDWCDLHGIKWYVD